MTAPHIVFLDRATLPVPMRRPSFSHTWEEFPHTTADAVAHRLQRATIAILNKVPLTAATLAACPSLKLVGIAATGTDVVDVAACAAAGVSVVNVRGYAGGAVAEHVFTLMLALRRSLFAYQAAATDGTWPGGRTFCVHGPPIEDLEGSTLGILGLGVLAQSVIYRAQAFGMHVLVAERRGAPAVRPGRTPFEEVLATADVLSLHCPLTPETRHLIDAEALARMKASALLINTARGALVDATALLEALGSGRLGGAGIDVLDCEPPPTDHPLLRSRDPRLLVTPHVAWASAQSMGRLGEQLVDLLEAWHQGKPRNLVTPT
ncbi:MAG: D-2-hydroxyacid dehydrogenase [Candidatus Sericytochromatia bacterium]|nr:D-2-hydroxyacid dehydrogenase [Candidatus Sericytochromatia bacterium]